MNRSTNDYSSNNNSNGAPMSFASAADRRDLETQLYTEQVRLLYRHVPGSLLASVINAIILLSVLWYVIPHTRTFFWLFALAGISFFRYLLYRVYERKNIVPEDPQSWGRYFTIGAVFAGASWGFVGAFLLPQDLAHQMFVIFLLAGTTAGAVVNLSSIASVAHVYIALTLMPLIARFIIEASSIHLSMAALAAIFMLFMMFTAKRMCQSTVDSLKLRYENDSLLGYLANKNAETEKLNAALTKEIKQRAQIEEGLRESEERIRAIVENVPDGIITIDDHGLIQSMNPAAKKLFGYGDDMYGKDFIFLLSESERQDYRNFFEKSSHIGSGKMVGFGLEITGRMEDGTMVPIEVGISDMWLNKRHLFIAIVRDITERKKIDRMKTQFIATVSHELRTPLTSVLGSLNLFSEGVAGDLSEQGESLLNIAHKNAERLVRQISDILEMDDIQSGKIRLDLSPIDLAGIIKQVINKNRSYAAERNVDILFESDVDHPMVSADSNRLGHVIGHLLSNALKFSPIKDSVSIKLEKHDANLRVCVYDHGPGIPDEFRVHVFQPFTQAEDYAEGDRSGAGLGLSIARAIIEKHKGTIGFDNNPQGGACFYFELPQWQAAAADNTQPNQALSD